MAVVKSAAQANDLPNPPAHLETIPLGSLVIPMDNAHQNLTPPQPFNLKAYGLVNALLQNDIPVKWVIRSGKLKDGIDFSATVERVYPSALVASMQDFRASAFIIDSTWINKTPYSNWGQTASQIIAAFGGNVAVYRLTQNVTVDVRYTLNQRPKIAVFNNGGNQNIHTIILNYAGISNYTVISAGVFTGLSECYTFCSEAHWASDINDTAIMKQPINFIYSGGNFFSQCHAVQAGTDGYEANMKIQTTNGFTEIGINTTSNSYYNPDMAIMQFHGLMKANQNGSGKNWRLAPGSSWRNGHYYAVSTQNSHDTVVVSCSKLTSDAIGGNVFYMGGHQYLGGAADFNNIELVNSGRIYLNAALIPAKRPTAFAISTSPNAIICQGQQVQLSVTGPAGATYQWSPTAGLNNPTSPTPIATPTVTTTYGVTAMNGSCPGGPAFVTVTVNSIPVAPIAGSNSPVCVGNSLTLSANTISGASYSWLGPNGFSSTLQNPVITNVTAASAGTYSVTATVGGCPRPAGTVSVIINLAPASTTTQNNVSCYGGNNGSATVIATGGTPSYTYLWNNGQTNSSATGLTVGSYTATVTDSKGCTTISTVSITQPTAPLSSSTTQSNVSCFGGSNGIASVIATGGTTPYTYLWNNGQTTVTAAGLAAGSYSVTTLDSKGCTAIASVTITQPTILNATLSQTNVSCYGGSNGFMSVSATGGIPFYTYLWSNGQSSSSITGQTSGTYSVTVTDTKGCTISASATITQPASSLSFTTAQTNVSCYGGADATASINAAGGTPGYSYLWQPGNQTTSSISGLAAGTYTATVTDSKGCTSIGFVTINQPSALAVSFINQSNVSCFGGNDGAVTANASGGTPNYSYIWMPGSSSMASTNGLQAGTYTVTVTDNKGCQKQNNVTITQPASALSVSVSSTPTSCYGSKDGTVASVASGGTSPYSYNWLPGNYSTQNVSSLLSGAYTIIVTDSKGCTFSDSVNVNQPTAISLLTGTINSTCSLPNGIAYVSVSGGVSPYMYQWSSNGGNSDTAKNLYSGSYTVSVKDANACSTSKSMNVIDNNSPAVTIISSTNVSCNGGATGSASAGISGGTAPFSFHWLPYGGNSPNATGLTAGIYTLTVTDANGCQSLATTSPPITEPPALALTVATTDVSCFGGSNGTATVSASGGTPGYTYTWLQGGSTGSSVTNLSAGTYTVQVMDINSCVLAKSFTINQPNQLNIFILSSGNVSCKGGNDGTAAAGVTGGTPFYTYNWLPMGGNGPTGTNLSAGTYTVNVTDNKGCNSSATVVITEPSQALTSVISQSNVSCYGGSNGTAIVSASGGTQPYAYLWNNGQTSMSVGGLTSGNYVVTTIDAKGCVTSASVSIIQPAMALTSTISFSNVFCYGGNNGSATVIATGGTPSYTYLWNNGQTNSSATGLTVGSYTATVTDSKGCTTISTVSITQPTAPLSSSTTQSNVSCFGGSNGIASVIATGGTTPYTYLWNNGQTTVTAAGLAAGSYSVTTLDSKGCTAIASVTITQPTILNATLSQTNVSCYGGSNGFMSVSATGGIPFYTYLWSNGQSSSSITGQTSGTYSVTVTDTKGCTISASATITQPASSLSFTTAQTNVSCYGGADATASINAAGGTPGYSYLWQPGNQTTSSISGLAAGTYTATVTDSKGCTSIGFVTINQPSALAVSFINQSNVSCFGGNDGAVTANASGGTPNYSYIWMPGSSSMASTNGLQAGTYTVTVTDNKGCQKQNNVTITQPASALSVSVSSTPTSCYGSKDGTVASVASGGTSPYSYNWLPGNYSTQNVSSLLSGAYTIIVTDSKGCTFSDSVNVNQPTAISLLTGTINSTCSLPNGIAYVSVSGGVSPYMYQWSSNGGNSDTAKNLYSGSYTVSVKDANACSTSKSMNVIDNNSPAVTIISSTNVSCNGGATGSASAGISGGTAPFSFHWLPYGGNSPNATGLTAGIYTLTVTDANGCQSLATTSPPITEPPALALTVATTDVSCFGGSNGTATVSASGGTPGYTYTWLQGGSTGSSVTNLSAGTYTVQVMDINSCVLAKSFTINQPNQLNIFILSSGNVSCKGGNDGTAAAGVTGGTPFYTYNWLPMGGNGPTGTNLSAGTYTVNVTDNKGCNSSATVVITEPSQALTSVISQSNVSCYGGSNGTAIVSASGGTQPYAYLWNNGQTSMSVGGLTAGNYVVTTIDAKGCVTPASVTITEPADVLSSITSQNNVSCYGGNDGSTSVFPMGGTSPYTYLWNDGQTTSFITGLSAGNYSIIVSDSNHCISTVSIVITEPLTPLSSSVSKNDISCYGGNNGAASLIVTGGTLPYTYQWSNGQVTSSVTGLIAGNYSVITTDGNGCTLSDVISIAEPSTLTSSATQTNICSGTSNGIAAVTVMGGTSPYTYLWNDGQTTSSATGLSVGNYSVTINDAKGCTAVSTVAITLFPAITSTTSQSNVSCYGGSDGSISVISSGGTAPFTYQWNIGLTTSYITGLFAGNYTVTVTDSNGCIAVSNVMLTQPAGALTIAISKTDVSCYGGNNGSASITVSGGTPSYSYQWNTSSTTSSVSGLTAGSYNVIVTDANACTTTGYISITEPITALSFTTSQTNVSCSGGNNGVASVIVSGGSPSYTYLWSNGQTTTSVTGLTMGNYSVTVTDMNGCVITPAIFVTEPPLLSSTAVQTNICTGASNGLANITATGGTSPYTYLWSDGQTAALASGLPVGNYSVTTTDAMGCTTIATVAITQFPAISSTGSYTDVSCNGENNGSATINPSGGASPFAYQWSNGQSTASITGLIAGTYIATLTDANGCSTTDTLTVNQPSQIVLTIDTIISTTCFNGSDGSASITLSGGVSPYLYAWSTSPVQTGSNATTLNAGTYTVTVTDANGCNSAIPATIGQPSQVITMAGINDSICLGQSGTLTTTASGGGGIYSYLWQPSNVTNSGTLTVAPTSTTTYTVIAQDQYGCIGAADSISAIVYYLNPANVQVTGTSPICRGQSSVLSVQTSGVTGTLTYSWSNNLGSGPGPYTITPAQPTIYTVTVTNVCGSSVTDSVSILFNPPPTVILASDTNQMCVPAIIRFSDNSVTGNNTDPITTWNWNFGDGTSSTLQNPAHSYVQAGTYSVVLTVTTSGGCTNNNASVPLMVVAHPIPTAVFTVNSTTLNLPYDVLVCTSHSVGATAYNWNFGDGNTSAMVNPQNIYTTVDIFQVQLIATSQYGCRDTSYAEITTNADVVFPNVFTPNSDGANGGTYDDGNMNNDVFFPYTSGVVEYKLQIFNRWGEQIFESMDVKKGWDGYYRGQLCQEDVYVWKAYVKLNNGKVVHKSGDVTLLR